MTERIVATDDGLLFRCPFFDSGWCYAGTPYEPNDTQGACNNPKECCVRQQMMLEYIRKAKGGGTMSNKFLHFALRTEDGYLAKDTRNNQLEIYEERKDAEKVKRFCNVVGVYVFSEKEYETLTEERDKLQNQIKELESFIIDISNTIDKFFHGLQRSDYVLHELDALLSKHTTHKGGNNE